jgi:hypothetical protein
MNASGLESRYNRKELAIAEAVVQSSQRLTKKVAVDRTGLQSKISKTH